MATLLLTAVGTAFGGPLGGALGAMIGRSADTAIFGGRKIEGPRLKELTVQTSSYGTAIPLHFGTVRSAGSVIWATDLVEHRQSNGGGKGRPSVTSYSYSASFAVAVASRPIAGIGRIWADGNLLRGAAGDLKTSGTMRVHTGHGDQTCDTLIMQAEGASQCPAHRHCAYVVFEDLDLSDFGNRLPSLTFEIIADTDGTNLAAMAGAILPTAGSAALASMTFAGFTIDQGSAGEVLATLDQIVPLTCATRDNAILLTPAEILPSAGPQMLPLPAASEDEQADTVKVTGWSRKREPMPTTSLCALRYYDIARDYQPGLQRGIGRCETGDLRTIELPAAMAAASARVLAEAASRRAARAGDTVTYRLTELDPAIAPGAVVRLPIAAGLWRIVRWEWQKDGILLHLEACRDRMVASSVTTTATSIASDAGRALAAADLPLVPTRLAAFELPWDGTGSGNSPALFAAASASGSGWRGAALFAEPAGGEGTLTSLGSTGRTRAITGQARSVLPPASPLIVDRINVLDLTLDAVDLQLPEASLSQLLQGANRALVGQEIIQFASAQPLGSGLWRLGTLLRGRGGTEWAIPTHTALDRFVLLDDSLIAIDPARVGDAATSHVVALGPGDSSAIRTAIDNAGTTLRPLSPVHGQITAAAGGGITVTWTRRARGAWTWPDAATTPLNEESERYEIAYGSLDAPVRVWQTSQTALALTATDLATLAASAAPPMLQVRQLGRGRPSPPLSIALPL